MEDKEIMNVKILNSSVDGTTNNKGGCAALAEYINHEDEQRLAEGKEILPYTTPDGVEVSTEEVIMKIDRNHSHLGKNDDKFYGLVVSPSEDEIKAMGSTEEEIYASGLKLMKGISDTYAQNFNRDGIEDSSDLVMFWKPHFTRGDNGEWQFHIHGIVSRKSKGMGGKSIKLSPLTNHRNTENGAVKGGFDRKSFFVKCEKLFDKLFKFERSIVQTFEYNNAQIHGTPEEKAKLAERLAAEKAPELKESIAASIARRRESIKVQNDVGELSTLLEAEHFEFPKEHSNALDNAVNLAGLRNEIGHIFEISSDLAALELNLMAAGITCKARYGREGGVDDLVFTKGGKNISGRNFLDSAQQNRILGNWKNLTGQRPTSEIKAEIAAAIEAERTRKLAEKVSQIKPGLKIGRR